MMEEQRVSTGQALVQTSPHIMVYCGEKKVNAGQLMYIEPNDGRAYIYNADAHDRLIPPAGFAATDIPCNMDDSGRVTLARQGRIRGFSNLIPGMYCYPSLIVSGAVTHTMTFGIPIGIAVDQNTLQLMF
jgi:hypothetical protein